MSTPYTSTPLPPVAVYCAQSSVLCSCSRPSWPLPVLARAFTFALTFRSPRPPLPVQNRLTATEEDLNSISESLPIVPIGYLPNPHLCPDCPDCCRIIAHELLVSGSFSERLLSSTGCPLTARGMVMVWVGHPCPRGACVCCSSFCFILFICSIVLNHSLLVLLILRIVHSTTGGAGGAGGTSPGTP